MSAGCNNQRNSDQAEEAIKIVKELILRKPDDTSAYRDLTEFCVRLHECNLVIAAYKELIERIGENADVYVGLGIAYLELHSHASARDVFLLAIRMKPSDAFAHYYLGLAYIGLGEREKAREEYRFLEEMSKEQRPTDPNLFQPNLFQERARDLLYFINH